MRWLITSSNQATKAYRKNERGEEMKKECGSYFDAITKKIIRIIDYLSVIKLCIEKLDHNFKVIDIRLTKVEGSVKEIQKLKSFPTEQLVEELKSREKKEISDAVAELLISLSKHGDLASLEAIRAILSDAYSE